MEFSEFLKNIVYFYKNDFFTDVEISIFNTSSQEISSVCHCHKLVLASAIPQLKNILFSNEDSHIILQDIEISEVKKENTNFYRDSSYTLTSASMRRKKTYASKDIRHMYIFIHD